MSAEDIALADQLLEAVDRDDREAVYGLFSDDIEYVTDRRTLRGIDELREKLNWGGPKEELDVEFERDGWVESGDGHVAQDFRMVMRWKENGEIADQAQGHIDLRIRDGKISRYERRMTRDEST
jgi:ketosteroid isomerase-like protein